MADEPVRGAIDRFEGDYAVVVLDDGQQLDWPRSTLPANARPGMCVVLTLSPILDRPREEDDLVAQASGGWPGELASGSGGWVVHMADGQELRWPSTLFSALAQPGGQIKLQLAVDAEETEDRRKRITNLLDDIFGEGTQ